MSFGEYFRASWRGNPRSAFVIGLRSAPSEFPVTWFARKTQPAIRRGACNIDRYASCGLFEQQMLISESCISMIPAKQLLSEIVTSLREVIAPAIAEPYPKAQAYMAAVILEFVARQVEERSDIEEQKHAAMLELLRDLSRLPEMD